LSSLFDTHAGRLYRLARRRVRTADDALDLLQETFLKAARSPESIPRGSAAEEAWLVRVLVNVQRDHWRKEAVRRRHDLGVSRQSPEHQDPERSLLIRTALWNALDHLPPRRRAVIVLSEIEELPIKEIASLLGITAVTVRWHLSLGRRELARRLRLGVTNEQPQKSLAGRRPAPSRIASP
jgi:RNA polymerase sigma-70 factor (ECF subfamily)